MDDNSRIKDRILKDVGKSIKLLQQLSVGIENCENNGAGNGCGDAVSVNSWLVESLCCHLDLTLRHGLRDPFHGFWPLLHGLSHSSTFQMIDGLQNIDSDLGKGLVWLRHTLIEGSLQSYISYLIQDISTLRHYYTSKAILRDHSCVHHLITLLCGLQNLSFNMNLDGVELPEASGFSGLTSMSSSISSPVDSGVALLDSDADITSTNDTNITEDVKSLREDLDMLPELEDNRINNHIASQEMEKKKDIAEYSAYNENTNKITSVNNSAFLKRNICENVQSHMNSKIVKDNPRNNLSERNNLGDYILPDKYSSGLCREEFTPNSQFLEHSDNLSSGNSSELMNNPVITDLTMNSNPIKQTSANRMAESCMALIEGRNFPEDMTTCKTDDSVNEGNWSQGTNIMSMSVGNDGSVIRRQHKKKRNGLDVKVKRVSFHEDFVNSADSTGFSASFLPSNPAIKSDVVKGRYSWCAEGDSPFFEQRKHQKDIKSEVFLASSVVEKINNDGEVNSAHKSQLVVLDNKLEDISCDPVLPECSRNVCSKRTSIDAKLPPDAERGTPEGQEDPPKTSSLLHLNSITDSVLKKFPSMASSIDWSSDTDSEICEHRIHTENKITNQRDNRHISAKCESTLLKYSKFMTPSKNSLFKRFMKSVTEKKNLGKKSKLPKLKSLFIPGAKPDPIVVGQTLAELESVYSSVKAHAQSSCVVATAFEDTLKNSSFWNSREILYRVFKVNSSYFIDGNSEPLLIVLSQNSIYIVGLLPNKSIYLKVMMYYSELETIIVGPRQQTLLFAGLNSNKQILVTCSNSVLTGEVVSHVEVALRRSTTKLSLPSVVQLGLDDMKSLKLQLSRDHVLLSGESLHHYSIVNLQDNPSTPPSTPLGPKKEGHLMFRPVTSTPLQPWEPGYFVLKGGVVYMFSDQENRIPKRVIPLYGGQCHGCRRIPQENRPHTFEIILGHKRSFQFAAADEYETSEWLQALVQSASGFFEVESINATPCSLVMTSKHLIACQETFPSGSVTILTCAAITDIVAISLVSSEDSWCILEFSCHEVHASSGDWAVYFSNSCELMIFKHDLEKLWASLTQEHFPIRNITNASLRQRCEETSLYLSTAWDEILLADH